MDLAIRTATFDSNIDPGGPTTTCAEAAGVEVAVVSVTKREAEGTSFAVELGDSETVTETLVWDESRWDEGLWASTADAERVEHILDIISAGSFPPPGNRNHLSSTERRQLRDAMIIAAHIRSGRDVFVTDDRKAFVNHDRRRQLERAFGVRIMTSEEFLAGLGGKKVTG